MEADFTAKFFAANRKRLQDEAACELIVVAANGRVQRGGDSAFPFAQDANFWYLTGVNEPDLLLVIDGAESYIIVAGRSESRQSFDGAVSFADIKSKAGVRGVYEETEGWQKLEARIKRLKKAGTTIAPPAYIEQIGLYTNPARRRTQARLKELEPDLELVDINRCLWRLRSHKQPPELHAIQHAIDITVEALQETLAAKDAYDYEYELEARLTQGFRARGASGHAFEPIVAAGSRACTLHYVANNGRLGKTDLVTIDVGAQVELYAADITRTISLGRPTKRQLEVHTAVLAVHRYACGLLKPGVFLKEYEGRVRGFMAEKLKQLGLVTTDDAAAVRHYFPHATSHFLGLNVHDVGEYDQPLAPNMVLTIEPGIYIPEEGIGVRIEDDVVITPAGIKILSDKLSRALT